MALTGIQTLWIPVRAIWTPCARHAARSRPAGPPTSVGQQPGPIPRFAGVARRRKRRLGGLATVSLRSFNGSAPRQESTPHPPRNFSFSLLKLTDCDNQRGLNLSLMHGTPRHWMRYPWSRSKEQGTTLKNLQNQSQQPPPKESTWARHRSRQLKRSLTNPKPRLHRQTKCG